MPTIPLISESAAPGASHQVIAPGGYEAWHFDASSDDGRLHLVAELHAAWADDARYLKRYRSYRRRPTRVVPPRASDFPAVTFALYEAGRAPISFALRERREDVRIAANGRSIRIGTSHAERSADGKGDGAIRLHLRGTDDDRTIGVDLTFRPTGGAQRDAGRQAIGGGIGASEAELAPGHRWAVIDPLCEVDGQISVFDNGATGGGAAPKVVALAGSGYHDQRWGTRPPGESAEVWLHGRVLLEDRAIAFEQVGAGDAQMLVAGKDLPGEFSTVRVEQIGGEMRVGPVHLIRPTVLDSNWAETVTAYEATVAGEHGVALLRRERCGRRMNPVWNWFARD